MQAMQGHGYRFDEFVVDLDRARLLHAGDEIRLRPKSFEALRFLVENRGRLATKEELIRALWPNTCVTDDSLVKCIREVRQALADGGRSYIRTVPRRGYIFEAEVVEAVPASAPAVLSHERESGEAGEPRPAQFRPRRHGASTAVAILVVAVLVAVAAWLMRGSPDQRSVAVLPFVAIGGNARDALLADGTAEEIIHLLATVPGLHVTSRTSSFHFKGRDTSVEAIGRELGVAHVLEGSVRSDGERFRVTVQLIDVASDVHIWSEAFEGELGGFLDVQKQIATAVAQRLNVSIDRRLLTGEPATKDLAAYQIYVEAWLTLESFDEGSIRDSITLFEAALERDPDFANAWSGLALARWVLPSVTDMAPEDLAQSDRLALAAAERAVELNGMMSSARFVLADSARVRHDLSQAEASFRAALAALPGAAIMHFGYSNLLSDVGRTRAALAEAQVNRRLDPLSSIGAYTVGQNYVLLGNEEEARRYLRRSRELGYESRLLDQVEAYMHLRAGDYAAARASWADLHDAAESQAMLTVIAALEDPTHREAAVAAIAPLPPWTIQPFRGRLYAALLLGERDLAWQAASEGVELGLEPTLTWWLPEASILRTDPRFPALAERLNLTAYWREYGWPDLCSEVDAKLVCR